MQTAQIREQMVDQQVRAWDVLDERVLDVLRRVPREIFVPQEQRFMSYADVAVPLPHGQHLLRPSVAGRLLQALELRGGERVLEVGTGTGFVTACLQALGARVRSLEIFADLAVSARSNLAALGASDVDVIEADALLYESAERYDAVAVTASLPVYDARFERLLAPGGRLFVIVGEAPAMEARRLRLDSSGGVTAESLFETVVDPLVNAVRPAAFRF